MQRSPYGKIEMLPNDFYGSHVAEVTEFEEKIKDQSDVNCDRCIVSPEHMAEVLLQMLKVPVQLLH